jgi:hypothetical protein
MDATALGSDNLIVLRTQKFPEPCPLIPSPKTVEERGDFEITINRPGPVTVRWDQGGNDVVIQTLATAPASQFDVNGMWFDAATNGSGLSIHHRRGGSDAAFGTWFLFGKDGTPRWYTFQSANWLEDGRVLEGMLVEVSGKCLRTDISVCPAGGTIPGISPPGLNVFQVVPAIARIRFESAALGRAEVSSMTGQRLFTSELRKLAL